ncbi:MAG: hypothetical protein ACREQA_05155, partial [Candidatus Binatia bacterium]
VREKDGPLESRDAQLRDLKSEMHVLVERMTRVESVTRQAQASATSEVQRAEESLNAKIYNLESQERAREESLENRDAQLVEKSSSLEAEKEQVKKLQEQMSAEIEKVRSELRERKTLLAAKGRDSWRTSNRRWKQG